MIAAREGPRCDWILGGSTSGGKGPWLKLMLGRKRDAEKVDFGQKMTMVTDDLRRKLGPREKLILGRKGP